MTALARARALVRVPVAAVRSWSISARLMALLAVIVLPLALGNFVHLQRRIGTAEALESERVGARLRVTVRQLEEVASTMRSAVQLSAAFVWPERADPARADERLAALRRTLPAYVDDLAIVALDGQVIASSRFPPAERAVLNFAQRDYFVKALASAEAVVSEPFEARVDKRRLVVFVRAMRDRSGAPLGLVVVSLDLRALSEILARTHAQTGSAIVAVSREGRIVAHSADPVRHVGTLLEGPEQRAAVIAAPGSSSTLRLGDGVDRLSSWSGSPDMPWVALVGTPLSVARATPLRDGLFELAYLLVITACAALAALAIGRRVVSPVRALQAAAHRVAGGDYAARVQVADGGELGALEEDFNRMVSRIEDADARREASEARLKSLLDLLSDWYWEHDEHGRLVRVTGARFNDSLGKSRWELPYEGVDEADRRWLDERIARREPFRDFEMLRPDVDGVMRWISLSGEPVFGDDGRFRGYRGIARDIDRRRRAEEALRRSEARQRSVIELSGAVLFATDGEGRFTAPQAAFERYTGFSWEAVRGDGFIAAVHPDDRERVRARRTGCVATGSPFREEIRMWSAEHRAWRRNMVRAAPRLDAHGQVEEWVGSCTDVHEQREVERAYRVSEERLSAATRGGHIGVFDFRIDEGAHFFSPEYKSMMGCEGEPSHDFGMVHARVNAEDAAAFVARMRVGAEWPDRDVEIELRVLHPDGRRGWVRVMARPQPDESGRLARYVGASVDITGIREREAQIAAGRERIRAALSAGGLVDWEWRPGAPRTVWGERRERILGPLPPGVDDYPELTQMIHPSDRAAFVAVGQRVLRDGGGYRCDYRIVWLDGTVHWIKSEGECRVGPEGERRMVGVAQDVTERVVANERLRESERRYRAVLETTTDTVVMIDGFDRIDYVNPAVVEMFGWRPEELAGQPLAALQPPAQAGAGLAEALAAHRRSDDGGGGAAVGPRSAEVVARRRDGTLMPIEAVFSTIGGARGDFTVAFLRNITSRKAAEAALVEAKSDLERRVAERTEELQAVNRELESFSYTVAHDLRAPLRAVDGFSQVLEEDLGPRLDDEARRYLNRIRANIRVMAQMIDELLEFSRIGRARIAPRTVDLVPLVASVAEELATAYPHARVEVGAIPPVSGDPTLLRVVLSNVIGNALKFSSKRADPRVVVEGAERGDLVEVRVTDNGVGFDPAFSAKLFGVFQRLHSQQEFEGTGIGLATVARIVSRHGGEVGAQSRPGEGATFFFTIPKATE